jgi:hypothetical protein
MYEVEIHLRGGQQPLHYINATIDEFADVLVVKPDTKTRVVVPLTSIQFYSTFEVD